MSRDDIVTAFAEPPPTRAERPWATAWRTADDAAIAAIAGVLGRDELLEPEIARHGGDVPRAAEALSIGRSTLYRRIRELGLEI